MDSETTNFKILLFPWLAHGHIFPYLELAKRILKRKNCHIHICSTSINFTSINNFIQHNSLENSIELAEIHLPPSHELPPHYHTTKNLPSNLVSTLIKAFQKSNSSFSEIITSLKPDLVIYDIFQPWAAKIASSKGIPAVHFATFGAATVSFFYHQYVGGPKSDYPSTAISLRNHERTDLDDIFKFVYTNVFEEDKDVFFVNFKLSSDIVLVKTCRGFEGKYMDYFSGLFKEKQLVHIGSLVNYDHNRNDEEENSEIIQWLSKRSKNSTVYISFGSEYFLSNDEIEEIAKGLELCGVNFIWIVRFPIEDERISVEEALPKGFLERVKERGIVVQGWAPQAKILSHESTGGFVSHCGWSSVIESVYFGVPIIAMPIKVDQPINARMLAEVGACMEVSTDENGVYKGEEIGKAMKKVMMDKSGDELRLRAQKLSEKMKMEEEEALDSAVEHLWQICMKNKTCDN
ncbi:hypothetical protein BUALT_Bualt12G0123600 [Buddleja alternifolia]|uniref:Glycosyltransferase n=1 Tax=Buddleja alternifolia TaxID=168488 RepID=A0AAV6WXJ0_9LAMI|nr:hypothetical protein BUALT_Bualt12G0123600 [Buddleja alternifolia]